MPLEDKNLAVVEDKEPPLGEVLSRLLTDDDFKDVTLRGTDGILVRANKYILASRSKVFQQMLLGGFLEANSPVVDLGYKGPVLKAVVEYIHTDSAHMLNLKKRKQGGKESDVSDEIRISSMVSLAAAAMYFNLQGLSQKVHEAISNLVGQDPSLSFNFLDACRSEGPAVPEKLSKLAMKIVRQKARDYITAISVQGLNSSVLEEILQDKKMEMAEGDLFNILRLWTEQNPSERESTAKELLKSHIALEKIDPLMLSSIVNSSGLATIDQISEAYKQQALAAREQTPGIFQQWRGISVPVWTSSKTNIFTVSNMSDQPENDLLNCAPMVSSVYQWKIEVGEHGKCGIVLGVVNKGMPLDLNGKVLWEQESFWGFTRHGTLWCNGNASRPESLIGIECGQTVTLTLNLSQQGDGNGTLSLSVGEGPPKVLITNLRHHLEEHPEGFVPAVTGWRPAQLRLLDFEKLED